MLAWAAVAGADEQTVLHRLFELLGPQTRTVVTVGDPD
jgi:hypothetical protein